MCPGHLSDGDLHAIPLRTALDSAIRSCSVSRILVNGTSVWIKGLKARRTIAQGKASPRATPWDNRPQDFQTLKGEWRLHKEQNRALP